MNKLPVLLLLAFAIFIVHFFEASGQTSTIGGKIIDNHTSEAVPFVHIFIRGTKIGAISDLHGNFLLKYPEQVRSAELRVSCLGYKTVYLPIESLSTEKPVIALEQDVVPLLEVTVKPKNPVDLLTEAFDRIPENYDTTVTMLSGYYKMSSLLGNKNIKYTEAFIDLFKSPYPHQPSGEKSKGDSIRLREVRTKPGEIQDWKLKMMFPWEKSIYYLEIRDFVKEFCTQKNALNNMLKRYLFDLEEMVILNGRRTYAIRIKPKKNRKKAYWDGYIYLDEETKAFVKFDVVSSPKLFKSLKSEISYILSSKLYKLKYDHGEWKESINYEMIGNKWYFKEVNSGKIFLVSSKKRNMAKVPVTVTLHYHTDSVKTNVIFPDTIDILKPRAPWWVTKEYIEERYRAPFWDNFDRQRGVMPGKVVMRNSKEATRRKRGYTFTKLDTLQGSLTPLRTCFDVGFYHLEVEVLPHDEIIKGSSLIRFGVVDPIDSLQIDLYSGMAIDSIVWEGKLLDFTREFNAVYISFPVTLPEGAVDEIKVHFSGRPVDFEIDIPMFAAFLWAEDRDENPWLQAICQGYGASGWWPNKDHFSDKPDSAAVSVTVPADLDVVSNGKLQHKILLENERTRFDWLVSYPINNYNLTLNVGKYARLGDTYVNGTDTLDLDYYVLRYNSKSAREKVKIVKPMLKTFEKYFGAYPFPYDGFKLVETPHAMEHQSCIALGPEYFSESGDYDNGMSEPDFENGQADFQVILHETAHEWWGNSVSCTDNAELWIHEAFATYAEALYIEDHYNYENSQRYLNAMKKWVRHKAPVIGKFGVNHIHYDIGDMYYKGALMLNTLRHVISNDSLWFSMLKGIQSAFKYQTVTTEEIVEYINQKTGSDYNPFFNQYLRSVVVPKLELSFETTDGRFYLNYRWVTEDKNFRMPVTYAIRNGVTRLLSPSDNWQKIELLEVEKEDFRINTDQFYINVEVKESTKE